MNNVHKVKEFIDCHECNSMGCHYCNLAGGFPIGWYFWGGVRTARCGPFDSKEEAEKQLDKRCEYLSYYTNK